MRQAPMTADLYLGKVVEDIDGLFGKGYAAKNPTLVAAMLKVCGQDFTCALTMRELGEAIGDVADAIRDVAIAIAAASEKPDEPDEGRTR
jgi:hypothetical protein